MFDAVSPRSVAGSKSQLAKTVSRALLEHLSHPEREVVRRSLALSGKSWDDTALERLFFCIQAFALEEPAMLDSMLQRLLTIFADGRDLDGLEVTDDLRKMLIRVFERERVNPRLTNRPG